MDTGPEIPETAEETGLGDRTCVKMERDARHVGEQQGIRPRSRAEVYQSARSVLRDERMTALEQAVLRLSQALEMKGIQLTELKGLSMLKFRIRSIPFTGRHRVRRHS